MANVSVTINDGTGPSLTISPNQASIETDVSITGSSNLLDANLTGAGTVSVLRDGASTVIISGTASASSDTASNLGNGSGIFSQKTVGDFKFKSLVAGPNIVITGNANELYISGGGGAGGGSSSVQVTGSSAISSPNFTGVGLATINYDGTYIKVSGSVDPTTAQLTTASGYLNTEIIANDAEIADLKTATGTLRADIDSNDNDITNLVSATGVLSNVSGVLRTDINTNASDITTLETASGYLNAEIQSNDSEIADLKTATGVLAILTVTGSNSVHKPDITGLGTVVVDINGSAVRISGTAHSDLSELQTATGYLNTEIQLNDTDISNLKTATGTLRTDVDSNDVEIADLKVASGYLDNAKSAVTITGSSLLPSADFSGAGNIAILKTNNGVLVSGSASASSDTAINIGIGSGLFSQKIGGQFEFKSIVAGPNITITGNSQDIYISGSAGGGSSTIKVTGSSAISDPNFTGVGLAIVDYNGTYVRVSGQVDPTTNELVTATGYLNTNKLANVVEDLTPQLGGNLEVLDKKITGMVYLHSSGGMIMALGDNTGLNTISILDSFGTEKISLSSSGEILLNEIHNPVRIQSLIGNTKILEITSNGIEMAASHDIVMQAGDLVDGRDVSVDGALLDKLDTASGYLNTEIKANDVEIADLKTATGTLSNVSGALRTDVTQNATDITNLKTASGYLDNTKSEVAVTGSNSILSPNLSGIGEVTVSYDGTYVLISGTAHTAGGGSDVSVTGSNTISSPDLTGLGTVIVDLDGAGNVRISGVASASSDTASNVGTGSGIFAQKSLGDFQFKSLVAGNNININGDTGSIIISSNISGVSGQKSLYIDAGAMVPSGAAPVTTGPTDLQIDYLLFDGAIQESAFFKCVLEDDWDKNNVSLQIIWDGASGASANDWVQWDVKAAAVSDNDSWWNTSLGALYSGNDQLYVTGDSHILQIDNITVAGSPANDDLLVFKISRNPSPTGSPSMAEDALLLGARVLYNAPTVVQPYETDIANLNSATGYLSTFSVTGSSVIHNPVVTGVDLVGVSLQAGSASTVLISGSVVNDTTPQLGGDLQTNGNDIVIGENDTIILDGSLSADGAFSGTIIAGTGGETIAFGDLVTLNPADSEWYKVDISVAAAAAGDARGIIGIAVSSSTDGNPINILLMGTIRADANFPTLSIGSPVYASTIGDLVVTQPSTTDYVIRIVGHALTADSIVFNPDNTWTTHV